MQQFLRKVRFKATGAGGGLTINPGGIELHEIKIEFNVTKSISGSANPATIKIWNLNEGHRNALGREFDEVVLEAGYMPPGGGSNVGIIFKGAIRDVQHTRDGPDIVSELKCADGDKAIRKAAVSKTFPKGSKTKDVLDALVSELEKHGVSRGELKLPEGVPDFKRPYSIAGGVARELNVLGRGRGFYWSIQNGTVETIPSDGFLAGVVKITPETGMVNTPTITDNGVKVSALLNPEIRPNRLVQVESQVLEMNSANGTYRVSQAVYAGDNRDGDFVVDVTGERLDGGKVDEGKAK